MSRQTQEHQGQTDARVVVDAQEFCKLLVSRKQLTRVDEPAAGLRGVQDLESGIRYFTDELNFVRSV